MAKRTTRTARSRRPPIHTILNAIGLGMATGAIVLGAFKVTTPETNVLLLAVGLFALALDRFA